MSEIDWSRVTLRSVALCPRPFIHPEVELYNEVSAAAIEGNRLRLARALRAGAQNLHLLQLRCPRQLHRLAGKTAPEREIFIMRIQRQNKHGSWDTLAQGAMRRVASDWGKYIYEFTNDKNENKTLYRITLDESEVEKFNKEGPDGIGFVMQRRDPGASG